MSQVTSVIFLINLFLCETKNVPVAFEVVYGYQQWQAIELQMAGQSWFVALERTRMNNKVCTSFKYLLLQHDPQGHL
jgi:hypothetical protein